SDGIDIFFFDAAGLAQYRADPPQTTQAISSFLNRTQFGGVYTPPSGQITLVIDNVDASGAMPRGTVTVQVALVKLTGGAPPDVPRNLYFIGTAGCGKSTMVRGFDDWMASQGLDIVTVNLDPGAERVPYDIDIDVRDWIRLAEVMEEHGLGPNGAQVVAADLLAMDAGEIQETMDTFRTNYFLIDTPGQMELFTFRE